MSEREQKGVIIDDYQLETEIAKQGDAHITCYAACIYRISGAEHDRHHSYGRSTGDTGSYL